jgi:bla regulator protein blaR1
MARTGMLAILAAGAVFAQLQDTRPAYEAAFIKANTSGSGSSSSNGTKGQIVMMNQTMKRLIQRAYGVRPPQVTGPAWMENTAFDIIAKYPPETNDHDRSLMLRTLLEGRFKLAVHRETREMPGYALMVAKSGLKLKPVEPGSSDTSSNGSKGVVTLTAKKTTMSFLSELLTRQMGEMVVDRTGLDGAYDFELRYAANDQVDDAPPLFSALQETLGIRLQPQKVPVELIVVDHVERVPTEN